MTHRKAHARSADRSKQLTLRGLGGPLEREIRDLARRERISLNKAALRLLEKAVGVGERTDADRIGRSLDRFIGTWTDDQADELLDSIRSCGQVDRDLWD
jgi:hypothetical protein